MIQFELPQNNESIIKIIGVGGGGGNAVNYMYNLGIDGVDFIVCNTDQKALNSSAVPTRIQLGPQLTQGLGAGANPEIGMKACEESLEEIRRLLTNRTKMVFVTAGMGGGTGTGGAPIVAKVAKDLGILTVGIVTTPFNYEGKRRKQQADAGILELRKHVDTILVISNDKLRQQCGNIPASQAFAKADDILATAAKCITDVINSHGHIVVDFADVSTVMRDGGVAILGSATASGENRAYEAVEKAMNSPLLNDSDIRGAQWVLLNINSAHGLHEHTLDEVEMIQAYVQEQAGEECDVIFGTGFDDNLGDEISVTVIATGFTCKGTDDAYSKEVLKPQHEKTKEVYVLGEPEPAVYGMQSAAPEQPDAKLSADPMAPTLHEVQPPAIPALQGLSLALGLAQPLKRVEFFPVEKAEEKIIMSLNPEVPAVSETGPMMQQQEPEPTQASDPGITMVFREQASDEKPAENPAPNSSVQSELDAIFGTPLFTPPAPPVAVEDDWVTVKGITINRRKGGRMMTDNEVEAEVNFELQKRAFEERASKLRSMSYNVNKADINQEEVNVPAYIRQNQNLENHPTSEEQILSNVQITNTPGAPSNFSNLNSFLNGKQPD